MSDKDEAVAIAAECVLECMRLQARNDALAAEYAAEVLRLTDELAAAHRETDYTQALLDAMRDERDAVLAEREALLDELESFNAMLHGIGIALTDHPSQRLRASDINVVKVAGHISGSRQFFESLEGFEP